MIQFSVSLVLMGASAGVITLALGIAWAVGFLILRLFFIRTQKINSPNLLAAIIALPLSPILLGLLVWFLMWISNL